MRKRTIYLFVLGLAVVVMAALASAGLAVSAQNSNSSPTMAANTNSAAKTAKPRRHKPKAKAAAASDAAVETTAEPAQKMTAKKTGRCDPSQQEQTDLSGTYAGTVKHGTEPAMDATLTITGNNFTITAGTDTHTGRITAVTTCGYTAVTVMMGEGSSQMAHSLRAKKVGDRLTLTSVPGEPESISFTTGGGAMKAKPRRHKAMTKPKPAASPPPQ